jgi:hypothetical protein
MNGDMSSTNSQNVIMKENTTDASTVIGFNEKILSKEIKIPITFEWKEGGSSVYVSGTFSNWNQFFLMHRVNNNFELTLDLPPGTYQYKFKVDNLWKFSKHHPTCNDGKGHINNFIDTFHFVEKKKELIIPTLKERDFKESIIKQSNGSEIDCSSRKNSYNHEFPAKKDLFVDAIVCPDNYLENFNIKRNCRILNIGAKEFMMDMIERDTYINENSSFLSIPIPAHINLNHLCTRTSFQNENVLMTSTMQRVRNKYVTMIYYKPIN